MDDVGAVVYLNLSRVERQSTVNGPGLRAVVWVQGCTLGCPGCFNVHTHAHERRILVEPATLIEDLAREPGIEGITLTGGEPFEQACACAILAEGAQARGLSVVVFTGYPLTSLQRSPSPEVEQLLGLADLLIAGPYVKALATDGRRLLGSSNQQLHFLTTRYRAEDLPADSELPVIEAKSDGQQLGWTGFPAKDDLLFLWADVT